MTRKGRQAKPEKLVKQEQEQETQSEIPEDYDKQIEDLQAKKREAYLIREHEKISNIRCLSCDTVLINSESGSFQAVGKEVQPDELLRFDSRPFKVECPNCNRINTVTVNFKDIPEPTAKINQGIGQAVWDELPVQDLTLEQVDKALEDELEGIQKGTSTLLKLPKHYQRPVSLLIRKLLKK